LTQVKNKQALNQLLFGKDARASLDQLSKFLPENVVKEEGEPKNKEDIAGEKRPIQIVTPPVVKAEPVSFKGR